MPLPPDYRLVSSNRVLIVDDDPLVCDALHMAVRAAGFTPATFMDPEEALERTLGDSFCLAFVDVNLKDASGLDLAPRLWESGRVMDVIFMSGHSTFDNLLAAIKLGAYDYLRKPFDRNELNLLFKRFKERVELKRSIMVTQQRHLDLIQSLPLLVYTLDERMRLTFMNRACETMLGCSPEQAMAEPRWLLTRVHPDDRDKVMNALAMAMDTGSPCFLECRLLHASGQVVHGILQSLPGTSGGPDSSRTMEGIFVDITDRVILERALVQNEKLKTLGAVSAEVAHEVRNPLMSIAGFARRLGRSDPDRPEVGIIMRESKRLEQLLSRIRNYLQPVEVLPLPLDVNRAVEDCVRLLFPEMQDREVWAVLDLSEDLPEVMADPEALTQVHLTLIRNAMAALEPGGRVLIKSFASGGNVIMEFRNTLREGQVINPEHLFLPFDEGGQSYGLPLAYRMVKDMGGLLAFTSEPGQAVFTVSLPRLHLAPAPDSRPEAPAHNHNGHCFEETTGVLTRGPFDTLLEHHVRTAAKRGASLGLVIADVDHFEEYSQGCANGDVELCLCRIARAMDQALKDPCRMLGRFGAQEFAALLPDADIATTRSVAESMRDAVALLRIGYNGDSSRILTVSLGAVSVVPRAETSASDLLVEAGRALFLAKQQGRNAVCHVEPDLSH